MKRVSNETNPTVEQLLGCLFAGGLTLLSGASNLKKKVLRKSNPRLNSLCRFYYFVKNRLHEQPGSLKII